MSGDGSDDGPPDHLRADEVLQIVDFIADCDPVIVGGQSVNIWAEFYAGRDPSLAEAGPFTSKDVDFFRNRAAAERLASSLEDGRILLPTLAEMGTPNAAVVVGSLNGRRLRIDFMASVLGVDDDAINDDFVAIEGTHDGRTISLLVMHPLDCLRSRLANVNILRRTDDQSIRQAFASVRVLGHYIDDLLAEKNTKSAQRVLKDLQFVIRDHHLGKTSHREFDADLDVVEIMERYVGNDRLDERWRDLILAPALGRLAAKRDRLASEPVAELEPDAVTPKF